MPLSAVLRRRPRGFTILEIATAIALILILATLLLPAFEVVRARMDKVSCTNNLRQLYVAANSYVQDHGSWPQVNPRQPINLYEEAWIEVFLPFGVGRGSWICPTTERSLGGVDYTQPENYRADYFAMPFDLKRMTPFNWATYPWFVERGNPHGNGNLMVQTNGAVAELSQLAPTLSATSH